MISIRIPLYVYANQFNIKNCNYAAGFNNIAYKYCIIVLLYYIVNYRESDTMMHACIII